MVEASCGAVSATLFVVVAIATLALLRAQEGRIVSTSSIHYLPKGWVRECAQYDPAHHRFLVSFLEGGLGYVSSTSAGASAPAEEHVLVPADPNPPWPGLGTFGFKIDHVRNRVIAAVADSKNKYSAVAAYSTTTWERIFFHKLAGPERLSLADDVAVDAEGNIYVTDALGCLIWKVSSDGSESHILTSSEGFRIKPTSRVAGWVCLNGIEYHPEGFLLVAHTGGGALFRVSLDGQDVRRVDVPGTLLGDGVSIVSPTQLAVAGLWSGVRLVESRDGWLSANITHFYAPPLHRLASSVTVKEGDVWVSYMNGFGIPYTSVIGKASFTPLI